MELKTYISLVLRDKKRRELLLLIALSILLVFILILTMFQKKQEFKRLRYVLCPNCHYKGMQEVGKIEGSRCPKCKAQLGYDWKCIECEYEFSLLRTPILGKMTKKEISKYRINESSCPKCGSKRTFPKKLPGK